MAALRARLVQLGDLEKSALATQQGDWLDAVTSMALVRFQVRHRLDVDGALGRATLDALNVPLARRVRQIEFALERSRWLPSRLASPPIIVNIPQFELFAFRTTEDRERDILIMDVVVGKVFPQNNTPVFVSDMTPGGAPSLLGRAAKHPARRAAAADQGESRLGGEQRLRDRARPGR